LKTQVAASVDEDVDVHSFCRSANNSLRRCLLSVTTEYAILSLFNSIRITMRTFH